MVMIFKRRRRCPNCNFPVEEDWNYCPNCGFYLGGGRRRIDIFSPFLESIEEEFRRIDKMIKEAFSFPSFEEIEEVQKRKYRPTKFGGISIEIRSGTGMKPIVKVKTYGDYKKFEPQIKKKLGVPEYEEKIKEEKPAKIPRITEEPEAKIERVDNKIFITINLPDVKNEKDIEIKQLEQSIEVKAFAGDKAYFKLIPIPPNRHIAKKEFKEGKLTIILE